MSSCADSPWDLLKNECPRLYKHGIVFECALGWHNILHDLSVKIEQILKKNAEAHRVVEGEESEMFALQVKEKYGTLRFYMSCESDEISKLIRETEALSSQTCENCGAPAKMRGTHWYSVRCDKCFEEEDD